MADIPTPELPDRTKIWYVGWRLTLLADEFDDRARKIQNVWLLGAWFYWSFKRIADGLDYAAGHCYDFDDLMRDIVKWVNGLIDGTVFRALLYWISGHFKSIVDDSKKWVRQRFAAWDSETTLFVYNPISWFWKRILYLSDWMENFLLDPETQIKIWSGGFAWWFGSFLLDPVYYIYGWILEAHPWIKLLMLNPVGFIVHYWKQYDNSLPYFLDTPLYWLEERLKQLPGDLGWMLTDPSGYLEYQIGSYLGIHRIPGTSWLETMTAYLFLYITAFFAVHLDWYKNRLCSIIMLFM